SDGRRARRSEGSHARRRLQCAGTAAADTNRKPCTHSDGHAATNAHPDPDPDPHANCNPDPHANPDANANPDGNPVADAGTDPDSGAYAASDTSPDDNDPPDHLPDVDDTSVVT